MVEMIVTDQYRRYRVSFNITMLIIAVFSISAGGSPNFVALTSLATVWSVGVGGNLPVDSAIFLGASPLPLSEERLAHIFDNSEFVPASHQYLLTILSIWWAFGQLIGSLVAWPFIANYSCTTTTPGTNCPRSSNMGWRYFLFTMGSLMFVFWAVRFFIFKLYESPKYLMGKGLDEKAVEVVRKLAEHNGRTTTLTVEDLQAVDWAYSHKSDLVQTDPAKDEGHVNAAIRRQLTKFDSNHVKSLFASRKLAYSSTLLIILWGKLSPSIKMPDSNSQSPF